jgi:hemoglobin-like flavoprotein
MDAHYATVGAALLATLAKGLGDGFDAKVEAAWTACYDLVATTMRNAAMLKAA